MKKKIKKTTKQYITVAAICLIVIGGIAIALCLYFYMHLNKEFSTKYKLAMDELAANQREVYVATSDIIVGEYILKNNIEYKKVFSTQPEATYFTSDDIGKMAIVEIKAGTHLLSTMASENLVDTDFRETAYNVITVNTNITHNDMVDLRILYPNGENYIVLSKKHIKFFYESKEDSYFWLSEEEILRMSSAIVDAYLYKGTVIYTTRYVEPNVQSESTITYTPSLISIELIQNSPNIVSIASDGLNQEVRKKIENRLAKISDLDISNINWDVKENAILAQDNNAVANKGNKQTVDSDGFAYYTSEFDSMEKEIEFGE